MPKTSLEELCQLAAVEKYDLRSIRTIKNMTIRDAATSVSEDIQKHLRDMETKRLPELRQYCIGVSEIHRGQSVFDPENPNTWNNKKSLEKHYSTLSREDCGRNGLIALAVLTQDSIPPTCFENGYITEPKAYALKLKQQLVEDMIKRDKRRTKNKTDLAPSEKATAYLLYIAFAFEGNGYVLDTAISIKDSDIKDAIKLTSDKIDQYLLRMEELSGRRIEKFYIGKSNVRTKSGTEFDADNPNTWKQDAIVARYKDHSQKHYGRSGLLVVAVVTKDSIPQGLHREAVHQSPGDVHTGAGEESHQGVQGEREAENRQQEHRPGQDGRTEIYRVCRVHGIFIWVESPLKPESHY